MNLVAKEFVAARDDEQGVLMLSTFAGASRELLEALIVNPYDATAMGEAIARALTMPEDEQRQRMRRMREIVRDNNIYRWAGSMLQDAARLRKRSDIQEATTQPPPEPPRFAGQCGAHVREAASDGPRQSIDGAAVDRAPCSIAARSTRRR